VRHHDTVVKTTDRIVQNVPTTPPTPQTSSTTCWLTLATRCRINSLSLSRNNMHNARGSTILVSLYFPIAYTWRTLTMMHQFPTRGVISQSKGKHMLYLSEYSAGLIYYRTNNLTTMLHLVPIIVMLLLISAHNKILLKLVPQNCTSNCAKKTLENRVFQGEFCTILGTI
jgi:hypothetical protein